MPPCSGASFDPALLAEAVRDDVDLDDDVWDRLAELVTPEPDGRLRFRNTLIRDAAYEGLPYRRRRVLHGRVGETIEATAGISLEEEVGVARAPLLRGAALGQGVGVLPSGRRPRAARLRERRRPPLLRARPLAAGRRLRSVGRARHRRRPGAPRRHPLRAELGEPADARPTPRRATSSPATSPWPVLAVKQVKQSAILWASTRRRSGASGAGSRPSTAWMGRRRAARPDCSSGAAGCATRRTARAEAIDWCMRGDGEAKRAGADEALAQGVPQASTRVLTTPASWTRPSTRPARSGSTSAWGTSAGRR